MSANPEQAPSASAWLAGGCFQLRTTWNVGLECYSWHTFITGSKVNSCFKLNWAVCLQVFTQGFCSHWGTLGNTKSADHNFHTWSHFSLNLWRETWFLDCTCMFKLFSVYSKVTQFVQFFMHQNKHKLHIRAATHRYFHKLLVCQLFSRIIAAKGDVVKCLGLSDKESKKQISGLK